MIAVSVLEYSKKESNLHFVVRSHMVSPLAYWSIWCAGLELNQRCYSVGDLQSLALATRHTDAYNVGYRI